MLQLLKIVSLLTSLQTSLGSLMKKKGGGVPLQLLCEIPLGSFLLFVSCHMQRGEFIKYCIF